MKVSILCDSVYDSVNKIEKPISYFVSDEIRRKEREYFLSENAIFVLNVLNTIFNVVAALITLYLGYNLSAILATILVVIGYILFDIIFTTIDNLVFHAIPLWQFKHMSYKKMANEKVKVEKLLSVLKADLNSVICGVAICQKHVRFKSCTACQEYNERTKKIYQNTMTYSVLLNKHIDDYEKKHQKDVTSLKENVSFNNIIEKEQESKRSQFKILLEELEGIKDKKHIHEILKKLNDLYNILNESPERYTYISRTFFIYFEELLSILNQFITVDKSVKDDYLKKIISVVGELELYISNLKERILNSSVKDITLNINVLYQELQKENMKSMGDDENV